MKKKHDFKAIVAYLSEKKHIAVLAVALIFSFSALTTYAWLYNQKSLQTAVLINEPNALIIGAGDGKDIRQLELSNIDVSDIDASTGNGSKEVVFCVYSESMQSYQLQLAHTTNIGFTYEIFPAEKVDSSYEGTDKVTYLAETFKRGSSRVYGGYINKIDDSLHAVKDNNNLYYKTTYERLDGEKDENGDVKVYEDEKVHPYAMPLYWQSTDALTLRESDWNQDLGAYINYYVLKISWTDEVINNKETDMIYLMAEAAGSGTSN